MSASIFLRLDLPVAPVAEISLRMAQPDAARSSPMGVKPPMPSIKYCADPESKQTQVKIFGMKD